MNTKQYAEHGATMLKTIGENPLVRQLADAYDQKNPQLSRIPVACRRLVEDGKKVGRVEWFRCNHTLTSLAFAIVMMLVSVLFIFTKNPVYSIMTTFLSFLFIDMISEWIAKKLRKKYVEPYQEIGVQMQSVAKSINTLVLMFPVKEVSEVTGVLEAICLELVKAEMAGLDVGKETEFTWLNKIFGTTVILSPQELRARFTGLVNMAEYFGLTTGDLTVHFATAKATYLKLVQKGEIMMDYVI